MINLLLTGRAAPNVFNGDIEYNKHGRKLVSEKHISSLLFPLNPKEKAVFYYVGAASVGELYTKIWFYERSSVIM